MEFKDKLKARRKELGLTQQMVADGVNVSRSVVAKWESGLVSPKEEMMFSLATFLSTDVDSLYSDTDFSLNISKNKKYPHISLIILVMIGVFIVLDSFNLIAMKHEVQIVAYIVLTFSLIISFIKLQYKNIVSISLCAVSFFLIIITHIILCINPYTYYYEKVEGGVKIIKYEYNIDSYYKKIYIEIPAYIKGKEVKVIGESAFAGCENVNILNIPFTVEKIERNAFSNSNIIEVCFSNGIKSIEKNAFHNNKISYVTLPSSVNYLGAAFDRDVIIVVNSVSVDYWDYIGNKTYFDSVCLQENNGVIYVLHQDKTATVADYFGNGKLEILGAVFYNDEPYIVDTIDYQSGQIKYCEEIIIPDTIRTIKHAAFGFNKNLKKVYIPNSVLNVEGCIFMESPNVKILVEHIQKPENWSLDWNVENSEVSWGLDKEKLYTFTPKYTGTYSITINNNSNSFVPTLEIIDYYYDYKTKTLDDLKVCVDVYLEKGITYKIKVKNGENNISDNVTLNYEFRPQQLQLGDNEISLLYDVYYFKFVPKYSAYYKLMAENHLLNIYDENLNILQTYIDYYSFLESDKTYYIEINKILYDTPKININIQDRMMIDYYSNISTFIKTMWYSTISKNELYIPKLEHYNFLGWGTYGGKLISNIEEYILEQNSYMTSAKKLNLYAQWEPIVYIVNYHGINDEIIKSTTYTAETGFYLDDTITIDNYIILSWVDQKGNQLNDYNGMKGNVDCYPNYIKEKVIITFDVTSDKTDGIVATLSQDVDWVELKYGEQIVLPIPTVEGFEFVGWYDGISKVCSSDGIMFPEIKFTDDTVLTAKWIRI